jgi:Mrp family chromosome partitioning ATPase
MERIQSAIQKARAARDRRLAAEGGARTGSAAPELYAVAADAPAHDVAAAWRDLPVYEPDARRLAASRIVTLDPGPQATPFDVMRTRLIKQMKANGWKRLAITSPGPACGKTMTAVNLAFSLARQAEMRTLVIEADLRRPAMARTLGLVRPMMFARALSGEDPAADHLVRYGENLAFGANQEPVENSAELLQGTRITEVLAGLEQTYAPDVMLFDMPPLGAGDDTLGFLDRVDAAMLVVAAGTTTLEQADIAEQELAANTNVTGIVLNKCQYVDPDLAYGYDYRA